MPAQRYLDRPLTKLRRKDRTLDDDAWIEQFLATAAMGHIAICWEGRPLMHSNLFWHDAGTVYWHTAGVGKLRALLDTGDLPGCFTVAEHGRLLPADTPFDFSVEYASVILYGTAQLVRDPLEKRHALEGLMGKYAPHLTPGVDYTPMPDSDIEMTSVHCLRVAERIGKHNVKPEQYPAYAYPTVSFIDAERAAGRETIKASELA